MAHLFYCYDDCHLSSLSTFAALPVIGVIQGFPVIFRDFYEYFKSILGIFRDNLDSPQPESENVDGINRKSLFTDPEYLLC